MLTAGDERISWLIHSLSVARGWGYTVVLESYLNIQGRPSNRYEQFFSLCEGNVFQMKNLPLCLEGSILKGNIAGSRALVLTDES